MQFEILEDRAEQYNHVVKRIHFAKLILQSIKEPAIYNILHQALAQVHSNVFLLNVTNIYKYDT